MLRRQRWPAAVPVVVMKMVMVVVVMVLCRRQLGCGPLLQHLLRRLGNTCLFWLWACA